MDAMLAAHRDTFPHKQELLFIGGVFKTCC
jgi:hypothetical protein